MKDIKILPLVSLIFAVFLIVTASCSADDDEEMEMGFCNTPGFTTLTFVADIQPIVSLKCTTGGCHGSGSFNGDFTTYQGMLPDLENNRTKEEVLIDLTMPQGGSEDLTDEERELFGCWLENGFPEN